MGDWEVLDLPGHPAPGDPRAVEHLAALLRQRAQRWKESAATLRALSDDSGRLKLSGDHARRYLVSLAWLPTPPDHLTAADRLAAEALQHYALSLAQARQQAEEALVAGRDADFDYRTAVRMFTSVVPLSDTGRGRWLDAAAASSLSTGLPPAQREYAIRLGRHAEQAEAARQRARGQAVLAGQNRQDAVAVCVERLQTATSGVDPARLRAYETMLATINGEGPTASEEYRRYYDAKGSRLHIQRKAGRDQVDGFEAPLIEQPPGGLYRVRPLQIDAVKPAYLPDTTLSGGRATLTGADLADADLLAQLRPGSSRLLASAKDDKRRQLDPDPIWLSPLDKHDGSGAAELVTRVGEPLGDISGRHAMADLIARARDRGIGRIERLAVHRAPDDVVRDGAGRAIEDLEVSGGAGRFDLVYARYGRDGEVVGYVLVETKGPTADLGFRLGLDGKHYYQGHPEYVRSLLHDMKQDRYFGALAGEISAKFDQGRVDYIVVQAKVAALVEPPDVPLTAARLREAARVARDELRPGETYRDRLAQEVDGVHVYAGYQARQFDLGYAPVFDLSKLKGP